MVAIGVAVFVAATDGYRNLDQSFAHAYAAQRMPDALISGPGVAEMRDRVRAMPGRPLVEVRHQADVGIRINGHALYGRAVGIPGATQPQVSTLEVRTGTLPSDGQLLLEQHLVDHYRLHPGDHVELLGDHGWQTFAISGSALSTEYLWPARSSQEILTTPEDFGVVFVADKVVQNELPKPVQQLAVFAQDRHDSRTLIAACSDLARSNGFQFVPRDQQASFRTLEDDVTQFGALAKILPWLFLAAVILSTYVLLARIVAAQRAVIGTLVANGLSAAELRRHYLGYGLACATLGIPLGLVGGYLLGDWITTKYTEALKLPMHISSVHPLTYLLATVAAAAVALIAAVLPAEMAARMQPAEAMRVAPPAGGGGRRSFIERLLPAINHIPARWRMMLRAVLRNRRRTIFTVVGVAVSVILVMVFAGMRDTLPGMVHRQFGQIERQDGEVVLSGPAQPILEALHKDPDVAAAELYSSSDVTVSTKHSRYETLMIGLDPQTRMHNFVAQAGANTLTADGVLLGVGLRDLLSIKVGDPITVTTSQPGHQITERVAGFVDEPFSPVVYISTARLRADAGPVADNGVLVTLRMGSQARAAGDAIAAIPGVVAYRSTTALASTMRDAFSLYNTLVGIMLIFAGIMAAAMLYNAMSANIAERLGELSALHAEGMSAGMLTRLITSENLMLAIASVPLGIGCGAILADQLLATYQRLGYHLRLEMQPLTPITVACSIFAAALLAQLPALQRIRSIDLARVVRERAL
ncbi:FtsX-like permease family protein [Mycobacterium sp.]|uniref:ABC transporter permease n=1 Tax=Mycobacterium sp. TaxID=1785 RepID=UPI0031D13872